MKRLTCNIDRSGRWARGISGAAFLIVAALVLLDALSVGAPAVRWTVGLVLAAIGAFQVFEAWTGWCIMRALGFRTPM
jgi:hypothetical protein